ncbi:hypothetical protein CRG98_011499 [Punica granatum]|uniref:Uncharacterized protein n=1 Tax=Punica granatum TaxID=22663 RepID=A0A2I0KI98_PUNGR|nr:hypothetical protein CRG98_011499 [Punica granatum]
MGPTMGASGATALQSGLIEMTKVVGDPDWEGAWPQLGAPQPKLKEPLAAIEATGPLPPFLSRPLPSFNHVVSRGNVKSKSTVTIIIDEKFNVVLDLN